MKDFRQLLDGDGIYVFDGAMGTRLYDKGIYINRSYDELNLTQPDLVREVHEEYVSAGADIIETNTFGATRHKLQPYGLESKLREINISAARIAREAAGDKVFVAGAIGPLGIRIEPYGPTSFDEATAMFKEQVEALLEGGVDLFILETFSELPAIHRVLQWGDGQVLGLSWFTPVLTYCSPMRSCILAQMCDMYRRRRKMYRVSVSVQ